MPGESETLMKLTAWPGNSSAKHQRLHRRNATRYSSSYSSGLLLIRTEAHSMNAIATSNSRDADEDRQALLLINSNSRVKQCTIDRHYNHRQLTIINQN
jgi:hypothetical protein